LLYLFMHITSKLSDQVATTNCLVKSQKVFNC